MKPRIMAIAGPAAGSPRRAGGWFWPGAALLILAAGLSWWTLRPVSGLGLKLPLSPDFAGKPAGLTAAVAAAAAQVGAGGSGAIAGLETLGILYHVNGYPMEAAACWSVLREIQPGEGRWCYYLADLKRVAVDDEGQKYFLTETVRLAPDYAAAWLNLAGLEFKAGRLEPATRAYSRRLALLAGDPYARFGLARIAVQSGDPVRGRKELEALLQQAPGFSSGHNFLAGLLAEAGEVEAAARERWLGTIAERFRPADDPWLDAMRMQCFDPDQLTVWADRDAQAKHGDRGRTLFERARQVAPDNLQVCANLGRFYLDANEPAKALAVLEGGRRLRGTSERFHVCLAEAYETSNRVGEALPLLERGLKEMPESASIRTAYASALDLAGRSDRAIEAYRAAMKLSPNEADPVTKLGLLFLRLDRPDEGYDTLKHAVQIQPGFPLAVATLGAMDVDAGRMDSAAHYILPYFEQYPGLPQSRNLVAKLYLARAMAAVKNVQASEVERICREGLERVPDSAELNGFFGAFYLQQHLLTEARELLEKSHRLDPADARVSLSLGELYKQLGRNADARQLVRAGEISARQKGDEALAVHCGQLLKELSE